MTKFCQFAYILNIGLAVINVVQGLSLHSHEFMLMALFNLLSAWMVSFGIRKKDLK